MICKDIEIKDYPEWTYTEMADRPSYATGWWVVHDGWVYAFLLDPPSLWSNRHCMKRRPTNSDGSVEWRELTQRDKQFLSKDLEIFMMESLL